MTTRAVQNPFVRRGGSNSGAAPQGNARNFARQAQAGGAPAVPPPGTPSWMPNLGNGGVLQGPAGPGPMPGAPQGAFPQQNGWQGGPFQQQAQAPSHPWAGFRDPQRQEYGLPTPGIQRHASRQDEQMFDQGGQANPYRWDGRTAGLNHRNDTDRMFDARGQIQAYTKKEALEQAANFIKNSSRLYAAQKSAHRLSPFELEAQRQVLASAMQDPEGFHVLGQELLLPIKELIDYEGFIRRVYRVRPLAQGELFRIAKDVRATAYMIGQDGQGIETRLGGKYVTPSEFKIGSFPTVDIHDVYQMNYDVLDRAQDTARQEIELEEDKRGLALIDRAAEAVNRPVRYSSLGVGAFEDVRFEVERHRLIVDKFLINRAQLSEVVKTMSTQVDPVSERELLLAGYMGSFLNAMIVTSAGTGQQEVVPAGTFYGVAAPEYLGEMAIRTELFSEPFNMFNQFRFVKGWAIGEIIGFVLPNPKACAKGVQ